MAFKEKERAERKAIKIKRRRNPEKLVKEEAFAMKIEKKRLLSLAVR